MLAKCITCINIATRGGCLWYLDLNSHRCTGVNIHYHTSQGMRISRSECMRIFVIDFFCCWKSKYKPVPWLNQIVWQPVGLGADCWPSAGMGFGEFHSLLATRALSRCFQSPMSNPSQPLEYWQTLYRCSNSFIIDIPIVPLAIVRIPECDLWYLRWAPKVKDEKPEMIIWFLYNAEHNHHNCQHTQGCRCSWLTSS